MATPYTPAEQPRQPLQPFFLLGKLANPLTLQLILGHDDIPEILPARVTGYRKSEIINKVFVLRPVAARSVLPSIFASSVVDGGAYFPRDASEIPKIERYGLFGSKLVEVDIDIWRGWRKQSIIGKAMVYSGDEAAFNRELHEIENVYRAKREAEEKRMIEQWRERVEGKVWEWLRDVVEEPLGRGWWREQEIDYDERRDEEDVKMVCE